jgi:hypothetical protein
MVLDRKIAFVNLSDASYEIKSIPLDWRRKFLGGRGINMHLLSKPYSSILDPFSPDNPLIFGAGLLAGILGFGSRMNITSRSPESGHLGDSNMGGVWCGDGQGRAESYRGDEKAESPCTSSSARGRSSFAMLASSKGSIR